MTLLLIPLSLAVLSLLSGCATGVRSLPVTPGDNTASLLADPQFPLAARAAPDWTKRALRTITRLETELGDCK